MTRQYTLALLTSCLALFVGCDTTEEEPLPAVREAAIFQPQAPCIAPLPPLPFQEPAEQLSDPRACLGESWRKRTLPVELTVVNGIVKDVRFYSQCEGKAVRVERSARACLEASFKTWRYKTVGPPCPGHDTTWTAFVSLRPPSGDRGAQGCGADG
jgi:hypothetical protein